MVARRTHTVNELAVVGEQEHAGGVLVQPPYRLHALDRGFLGPRTQGRGQECVNARISRWFLRAFGTRRFVQKKVSLVAIGPVHALHPKAQTLRLEVGRCVAAIAGEATFSAVVHLNIALLDQPGAHPSGAKTLAV